MAPIKKTKTRGTSRDILGASSRPTLSGQAGPRVIKNKAKDLARHGAQPWDDYLRQQLVDYHTSFPTWEGVANMLHRSNQAIRLEWKRMLAGDRDQGKGGQWERKAKACEEQRKIDFPSRRSRASNTAPTAPAAGRPAQDSSVTPRSTVSISRSPESSSNTTLSRSPEPRNASNTASVGKRSAMTSDSDSASSQDAPCDVPVFRRPSTTMMVLDDPFRSYKSSSKDVWYERERIFSEVPQKMPFRVDLQYEISTSLERTDSSQKEMRLDMVRQEIADYLEYYTSIDITDTDMTGMDQTDTRDDDDPADAMRYQSLGSEYEQVEPHESRMLFREKGAWVRDRHGKVAYLHPWGFRKFWVGKVQLFPDVALKHPDQIAESCKGLFRKDVAASLREMGIGQ